MPAVCGPSTRRRTSRPCTENTESVAGPSLVRPKLTAVGPANGFGAFGWAVARAAGARGLAVAAATALAIVDGYGWISHGGSHADTVYRSVRAAVLDL